MNTSHRVSFHAVLLALSLGSPSAHAVSWPTFFKTHSEQERFTLGVFVKGAQALSLNASLPMIPASNQKIITAITALKYLGDDFRFFNQFDADIDTETHTATRVVIQVSGDPTWGYDRYDGKVATHAVRSKVTGLVEDRTDSKITNSNIRSRLNRVILELKKHGIQKIVGPIEIKLLRPELDELARLDGWKSFWDMQCMATMPTAFQLNRNCGTLRIASPKSAVWKTDGIDIPVTLDVVAGMKDELKITPNFNFLGRIESYSVTGQMKNAYETDLPVHMRGDRWLRNIFTTLLAEEKIALEEGEVARTDSHVTVDLSSLPLLDILKIAYPYSINTVMDRLFYEVGFHFGVSDPAQIFTQTFHELVQDDSAMEGVVIHDGSGLDVRNRFRPDALHLLLSHVQTDSVFESFWAIQVRPGRPGTLSSRLLDVSTKDQVFGKTGTLSNANNLSGYFVSPQNKVIPFVVLTASMPEVSESAGRKFVDAIVLNIAAQNSPVPRALH